MNRDGARNSLWQDTTPATNIGVSTVTDNQHFDVIIAGAGITGLTAGLLLQKAGKSVLIAEARTIAFGTTGGTTAHLNTFLDTPYSTIQKNFGDKDAELVAKAVRQSLELIKRNIEEYNIDCEYVQLPGYLFAQDEKQVKELDEIYKSAKECKVACEYTNDIPVPIPFAKALVFEGQATFHPTRYVMGLARAFKEIGGVLLENCRVTDVEEAEQLFVKTEMGEFTANYFIYATHVPPGVNLLHFRCAPYRSYAIAVKLENESDYPNGLVYDMYDPYHYYRTQTIDGELYFIAGGEDHKTGHEQNTTNCFRKLEAHTRQLFPVTATTHQWSSQYYEPTDGIPYIGHLPGHPGTMYVATGFGGNGMIYSGVAAITLTDMIAGGSSEYEELFDPNRIKMVAGFTNFVKEAADVVGLLVKSIFPHEKLAELADIAPGEAKLVKHDGHHVAIYKSEDGQVHALNAACTHIKCEVAWNNAEQSWDCPCHGSRFNYKGEMITAPARKDLSPVEIQQEEKVK